MRLNYLLFLVARQRAAHYLERANKLAPLNPTKAGELRKKYTQAASVAARFQVLAEEEAQCRT